MTVAARLALAAVLASSVILGTALDATAADRRPCVTRTEFGGIRLGMTLGRVHRIFDTRGEVLFQNPGAETNGAREYRACPRAGLGTTVQVQYNNYDTGGGPFRVVHIDSY